jgi:hypothetical protein
VPARALATAAPLARPPRPPIMRRNWERGRDGHPIDVIFYVRIREY